MSTVDSAGEIIAEISRRADDAEAQVRPVYMKNKRMAFVHDVGLTALGASGTVLAGMQSLTAVEGEQVSLKFWVLIVTAAVTVFAACNQFFKFKSRADACHLALRNISDVRDGLALIAADKDMAQSLTPERATGMRDTILKAVRDADLPHNWSILPSWPGRRPAT